MRLAYLVVGLVTGFGLWSSPWASSPIRLFTCAAFVGASAIAAWGHWRGRAVDGWVADFALFVINTHRFALDRHWLRRCRQRRAAVAPNNSPTGAVVIVVTGRAPRAGATTVALELAAGLEIKGYPRERWSVRDAPMDDPRKPSPSQPRVSVASVGVGRVVYLDRGAGPFVAGIIPEDELVRQAAGLNQATVIAFPESAAGKAFRNLVEVIAAVG